MKLSLSTAVAPTLGLDELALACRARGLEGLEIVVEAGAATSSPAALAALVAATRTAGARVVAIRAEVLDAGSAEALAGVSAELGVPVSVSSELAARIAARGLPAIAEAFARAGGRLLLGHGTLLGEALARLAAIGALDALGAVGAAGVGRAVGLAWDLCPSSERLDEAGAVLFAARDRLGLVRLHGGGPEQRAQDGLGLGPLLVDLALTAYAGPIVMCPSAPAELPRWGRWLSPERGSQCGAADEARAGGASGRIGRIGKLDGLDGLDALGIDVDVRDVEPKDRMELVMGAYRALTPNATLRLTLDHDPICMFHTLTATEPTGSFRFRAVDDGPEVWRAEVTRL